jgi:transcription antitermination factor NusG
MSAMLPNEDRYRFFPQVGDRIHCRDGTFAGMDGEIVGVDDILRRAQVRFRIWERPVDVDVEYDQIERVKPSP